MKDVWAFGLMFPAFYPFLDWALLRQRPSFFSRPHVFLSCVYPLLRLWAYWLLILSYHFIMSAITLPSFLLRVTRELVVWCFYCANPFLHQSLAQGFLGPFFISLPLLGFIDQHSYCASPFFIHRASLAHLLPLYLFYFH